MPSLATTSLVLFWLVVLALSSTVAVAWLGGKAIALWAVRKHLATHRAARRPRLRTEGILVDGLSASISIARLSERLTWKFGYQVERRVRVSHSDLALILSKDPQAAERLEEAGIVLSASKRVPHGQAWISVSGEGGKRRIPVKLVHATVADRNRIRMGEMTEPEVLAQTAIKTARHTG